MQLDLNLLIVLDALLEEGSVTGAAQRLHLSAPATSRSLSRIRKLTGDEVLVRTGRTMTPTPYATAVRAQVHALVQQAEQLLTPRRELDVAALERVFTLQCHDAISTAVAAALLAEVRRQAPAVQVRFLAEAPVDTDDLRHARVDLEVGAATPALPEIRAETVGHDRLVVLMRPGHPCAGRRLTLRRYAAQEHLTVSRRGRLTDPIDEALAVHLQARKVVASAPTVMTAAQIVRDSDVLVTAPERMCAATVSALGLVTRPLPLEVPPSPVTMAWHQRYDTDPAHTWLRGQVRAVVRAILP